MNAIQSNIAINVIVTIRRVFTCGDSVPAKFQPVHAEGADSSVFVNVVKSWATFYVSTSILVYYHCCFHHSVPFVRLPGSSGASLDWV